MTSTGTSWSVRDYQRDAVDRLHAGDPEVGAAGRWEPGDKQRRAIVLPTGTGKTRVIGEAVRRERVAGRSVAVMAHRDFLLDQMTGAIQLACPDERVGRVAAGQHLDGFGITAAMTPTLARAQRRARTRRERTAAGLPPWDTIVLDECHRAGGKGNLAMLEWAGAYAEKYGARLLGVTATLTRGDRIGLGDVFQDVPYSRSIQWAIESGWLVMPHGRVVVAPHVDLGTVGRSKSSGDYDDAELGDMVVQDTAEIVRAWLDYAGPGAHPDYPDGRTTVAFVPSIASAHALAAEFVGAGVATEVVIGETTTRERNAINDRLASGATRVLVNVMVATEGWDFPAISCVLVARPTRLAGLYTQMVGRGLRLALAADWPYLLRVDKSDCLVLDVVGVARGQALNTVVDLVPSAPYDSSALDLAPCGLCGGVGRGCGCPREVVERDPDGGRRRLVGPAQYEVLDLVLVESDATWLATPGGLPFLPNGGGRYGVLWHNDTTGTWRAGHVGEIIRPNDGVRLANGVTLEQATAAIERWARATGPAWAANRGSAWRKRRASPELVQKAHDVRAVVDRPERYTAGALSDLIAVTLMARRLD